MTIMITTVLPYQKLSLIYDQVMEQVNYKKWAKYVVKLLKFSDIPVRCLLDASCGTGSLKANISSRRYQVYCSDLSVEMIKAGLDKNVLNRKNTIVSSIENLAWREGQFDALLFLYDSINYIATEEGILKTLNEMRRVVKPSGLIIFDAVTPLHCLTYFKDYHENAFWNEVGYNRHSYYIQEERSQINEFEIIIGNKKYYEHHRQIIYSKEELMDLCHSAGLNLFAVFDDFSFHEANDESERIHFVCTR